MNTLLFKFSSIIEKGSAGNTSLSEMTKLETNI